MARFIRGTTPTFTIQLTNGVQYTDLGATLFFRFKQGSIIVDAEPEIANNIATIKLTQDDTLKFKTGKVQVQLIGVSGNAATETVVKSDIAEVIVDDSIILTPYHNA